MVKRPLLVKTVCVATSTPRHHQQIPKISYNIWTIEQQCILYTGKIKKNVSNFYCIRIRVVTPIFDPLPQSHVSTGT